MIPADCILIDDSEVLCSESNLTGESSEVLKSRSGDCFLLSSCLITGMPKSEAGRCTGLVIAVGMQSQWGKIKASLMTEVVNTPLQDKLQDMTAKVRTSLNPIPEDSNHVTYVDRVCWLPHRHLHFYCHTGQHLGEGYRFKLRDRRRRCIYNFGDSSGSRNSGRAATGGEYIARILHEEDVQ